MKDYRVRVSFERNGSAKAAVLLASLRQCQLGAPKPCGYLLHLKTIRSGSNPFGRAAVAGDSGSARARECPGKKGTFYWQKSKIRLAGQYFLAVLRGMREVPG